MYTRGSRKPRRKRISKPTRDRPECCVNCCLEINGFECDCNLWLISLRFSVRAVRFNVSVLGVFAQTVIGATTSCDGDSGNG